MLRKISKFIPALLWMAAIFIISSFPDLPSNEVYVLDFLIKKTAHVLEYSILFLLWYRALDKKSPAYAFMLSLAYAFTDEAHQLFVPGRTGLLRDVAIDSLGMIFLSYLIVKFKLWKRLTSPLLTKKHGK